MIENVTTTKNSLLIHSTNILLPDRINFQNIAHGIESFLKEVGDAPPKKGKR